MIQESLQIIAEFKDNASAALKSLLDSLKGVGSQATAAGSGLNAAAAGMNAVNNAGKQAAQTLDTVAKSHAGVNRELLVLAHEASQGSWSRFGGSLLVLGEQTNALGKAFQVLALGGGALGGAIGIAAVAIGAMGYEMYKANQYAKELSASMALTNNYAATGAKQFDSLAQSLSNTMLTSAGKAKDALIGLISTGQFTGDQVKMVSEIIVKQSLLSGESVKDLTKHYAQLADQPGKLAEEVNKSMHILTPAQQEQIRQLEATGEKTAAANVVYKALIDYFNGPAKQAIQEQVGWLSKISQGWAYFFDTIAAKTGIVKGSLQQQLKDINKEIKEAFGDVNVEDVYPAKYQPKLQALLDKRKELMRAAAAEEAKSTAQAYDAFVNTKAQESGDFLTKKLAQGGKTLKEALAEFDKMVAQQRQYNPTSGLLDEAQLAKARQKIIDSFKDPAVEAAARQAYEAQLAALDGLVKTSQDYWKKQSEIAKTQLTKGEIDEVEYAAKIHTIRVEELKDQEFYTQAKIKAATAEAQRTQNRSGVKDRQKFADDIKHIQNEEEIANLQYEQNLAQHARTVTGIYNKMLNDIDKTDAARRKAADRDLAKVTMSPQEAQLADAKNSVVDRFDNLRAQITEQLRVANASTAEVQKAMEALDAAEKKAMDDETMYYDRRLAATTDWKTGVVKAVKDTQEAAKNAAAQMQSFINDITKSFEDGIYNFLQTGKFSFKDLENSWVQTINRMVAKALAAKLQEALFGGVGASGGSGWVGTGLSFLGSLFGSGKASGGPVNAGTVYPVGENGPELFAPSVGGTIIPNHQLGQTQNTTIALSIHAMDSQSVIQAVDKHQRQIADIVNNATRKYNLQGA